MINCWVVFLKPNLVLTSDIVYFNRLFQSKVNNCTVKFAACITLRDTSVIIRIINIAFLNKREYNRFSPVSCKNSYLKQNLKIFTKKVNYKSSWVFQNFSYYSVWSSCFFILQLSKYKQDFFLGNWAIERTFVVLNSIFIVKVKIYFFFE